MAMMAITTSNSMRVNADWRKDVRETKEVFIAKEQKVVGKGAVMDSARIANERNIKRNRNPERRFVRSCFSCLSRRWPTTAKTMACRSEHVKNEIEHGQSAILEGDYLLDKQFTVLILARQGQITVFLLKNHLYST